MARRHSERQPRPLPRSLRANYNISLGRCDRSPASSPRSINTSRLLPDVAEPEHMRDDADDVPQDRPSEDGQRLLRRFELAIDVMSAELERIEQRDYDR
jgi:hypothetical protein